MFASRVMLRGPVVIFETGRIFIVCQVIEDALIPSICTEATCSNRVSRETRGGFAAEHKAPAANWSFAPPSATVDSPPSARDIGRLSAGVGKR